jgi:hypothetical protein
MTQVSIGRVVHYTLTEGDVAEIGEQYPIGDPTVRRNPVRAGQKFPADVVAVFGVASSANTANLQVKLDGNCAYWATSRIEGTEPGTWAWPLRA